MPKLPRNMVRRKDRPGYYFRQKRGDRTTWIALGDDYTEACRKLRRLKSEGPQVVVRCTVRDAAREWCQTYVANARNAYGRKQTADRVRLYLERFMGHMLLHRIGPQDFRAYRVWLEQQGLSAATVKHVLSDARCLLNWAEGAGYIERTPFPKRLMPRLQERPPDRLSDDELLAVTGLPEPFGFVVRLALATGLRWGELTRAQSTDVEQECGRRVLVVHRTKSGKLRRVPIPAWFAPELRDRVGRLVPFASSDHFNRAVRLRSGVRRFHVHQLRHTFACQWLERDGSLAALQEVLGHASIVTTQRYARLSHDMVMREAERIEGQGVAKGVASPRAAS